jgi:pimeloyl-ACP methyl ester carboxylesterase
MRVREWAFPVHPVDREVLANETTEPDGRPPLLFVHGLGHGAWCWAESWMPRAAESGWSAYAVSLRAHGGSGGRDRRHRVRLAEYEHDLLQTAVSLPRPPVVVAHSLGCVVASRVAARYPFAAIVLLTPVGVTHGLDLLAHTARRAPLHVARMTAGLPVRLRAVDLFHHLDASTARGYVDRLDDEPPLAQLQIIARRPPAAPVGSPPVLVYGAAHDTLVPAGGVERTARFYGVPVRWLPDIGHDVMLDTGSEHALDTVLSDLSEVLGDDRR